MGVTFKKSCIRLGGGIPDNKNLKPFKSGGLQVGCLPEKVMDNDSGL